MVGYRRNKPDNPEATFFLTMTTFNRKHWFGDELGRDVLLRVMTRLAEGSDLEYEAWVILPDHVHWLLRPNSGDYSRIVSAFKYGVGAEFKKMGRLVKGQRMWQSRFWEHTIRDEDDYTRCVEYIHYNPVQHGYASAPKDWPHSSFGEFVKRGLYPIDWAEGDGIVIAGSEYD
jgi:putative transposase